MDAYDHALGKAMETKKVLIVAGEVADGSGYKLSKAIERGAIKAFQFDFVGADPAGVFECFRKAAAAGASAVASGYEKASPETRAAIMDGMEGLAAKGLLGALVVKGPIVGFDFKEALILDAKSASLEGLVAGNLARRRSQEARQEDTAKGPSI